MAFWKTSVSFRNPLSIVVSEHLGDHIKKKRFSLALLQKDVAKILNVSEDTVTYWENGRSVPQIQFYPKIIEFLGYTPFSVDTSTLAGRMKRYRMENGVSQEDLGKLVGVNESTVFNWEKGYHKPFASKLTLLEKIIN